MGDAAAPRKPVTREDVARYAGVSPAVVSYVTNPNSRPVAATTRARVLEAIEVLGYRPNAVARALRIRTTTTLGLIVPDVSNPFFAELARTLELSASKRRYGLLLANSFDTPALESAQIRNLIDRRVDGLIIVSATPELDLATIQNSHVPVVLLDQVDAIVGVNTIGVDFRVGARAAVEHLIGHGHEHIGIIIGDDWIKTVRERETGWLEALSAHRLPSGPMARAAFSREGGYAAALRLLDRDERPSAIFASSDQQAVGALRACHELGISVPDELALISFDGSHDAAFSWPTLSTVKQPVEEFAPRAVELLTAADALAAPAQHHLYRTQLILRQSCGCNPMG